MKERGELNYKLGKLLGVGGNSHCYEIMSQPQLVLVTLGSTGFGANPKKLFLYAEKLLLIYQQLPREINVARILEVGYKNNLVAVVMERALGLPLHDRRSKDYSHWSLRLQELATIPQRKYTKLIKDMKILHTYGLCVDPSKPDNIFYDPSLGFTFIDLHQDLYFGSLVVPFLWTYNLFKFREKLSKRDAFNIKKILEKLLQAGDLVEDSRIEEIAGVIDPLLLE